MENLELIRFIDIKKAELESEEKDILKALKKLKDPSLINRLEGRLEGLNIALAIIERKGV